VSSEARSRAALLGAAALLIAACSAPQGHAPAPAPRAVEVAPIGPARWLLTDRLGVRFDEAGEGASFLRAEPAIVDGVRMLLDAGRVLAWAPHGERLSGFRTLPDRLGGGFILWSEGRVYRADRFLGDPVPIADVGSAGGARPWLSSVLLRTSQGLFELDPRGLAIRRAPWPFVSDAIAVDEQRGARVDELGRALVTLDGGKSWIDVLATRGARVVALRENRGGITLVAGSMETLYLGREGPLGTSLPSSPPSPPDARTTAPLLDAAWPTTSRALPPELFAHAVASGAPLAGDRALITREGGLRVIALATGLAVADVKLAADDPRFARCQALHAGSPPRPMLACGGEAGVAVLALDEGLAAPSLEATFLGKTGAFFTGPRGRLAVEGRCGPADPRPTDFGPGTPSPGSAPEPPAASAEPVADPPLAEEARVCVRASASWVERHLIGPDARRLYRWIPGDDGAVTALVLGGADDAVDPDAGEVARPSSVSEGARVIRVDPRDPALDGGAFPAILPPQREPPYRMSDGDFWEDDDGSIRGWVRLPEPGRAAAPPTPGRVALPLDPGRGGRLTGVRIGADGHVITLGLPPGTTEVVTGGRFALALADREGGPAWFESTDGGLGWTPIEAPPVGRIEPPSEESVPFGCSPLGCALGNGLVRVGWGSPPPRDLPTPPLAPAKNPRPREVPAPVLRCQLASPAPWIDAPDARPRPAPAKPAPPPMKPAKPAPPPAKPAKSTKPAKVAPPPAKPAPPPAKATSAPAPVVSLRVSSPTVGEVHDHTWSAEVMVPFQPAAALRRLSARDPSLTGAKGSAVPLLLARGRDPVDLLLLVEGRRARATGPAALLPFAPRGRFTVAAETADGLLAVLDTERWNLVIARGASAASAVRLGGVADPWRTRLTLAQRLAGGLSVVGSSASSGDVFAGDLDLGRAEVGPLVSLGRLDALLEAGSGACASAKATRRFLIELPITVRIGAHGDHRVTASLLIASSGEALCVEGVEAVIPPGRATVLSARLGRGGVASIRRGAEQVRAICALETRPAP